MTDSSASRTGNRPPPTVCFSVVSHGQGDIIRGLFADLRRLQLDIRLVVVLNIAEDEGFIEEYADLQPVVIRNSRVAGFGANHNRAFAASDADIFVVVNPDIRLTQVDLSSITGLLQDGSVGACAPLVVSSSGAPEDSVRRFPSIPRLLRRVVLKQRSSDYAITDRPITVDWVAGMFVAFRRDAFTAVGGFDERYFMYMEDVDICKRLGRRGWSTVVQPAVRVVHDAQRASRKSWRHLRWHLSSALRYFLLPTADPR